MRRASLISGLLILTMALTGFRCAAGGCINAQTAGLAVSTRQHTTAAQTAGSAGIVKASPKQCNLRAFSQSQSAVFRKIGMPTPLSLSSGKVSPPVNAGLFRSSVGSPESDRGPPRS